MVDGNEDSSSKPKMSESPPQRKKSRTVITTTASDDAEPTTPIFPGPLFPAVGRISTLPPTSRQWQPPDPPASSSSSSAPADHRDFSDRRDWVFSSFVLPQNASKRGKKLPSTSSDSRAAHANKLVDAPHRIASPSPPPPAASVPKPEAERKKLKVVPTLASASSTSESTRPSSRRTAEFKRSLLLVVVSHFTPKLSVHSQLNC